MTRFGLWNDKTLQYEEKKNVFSAFRAYAGMGNFCWNNISKTPPEIPFTNSCSFCEGKLEEECYFFTCPLVEGILCKDCGDGTTLSEETNLRDTTTIHLYKLKIYTDE